MPMRGILPGSQCSVWDGVGLGVEGVRKKKELVNIELVSPTNALVARNACTGVHPNVDGMDEKASTETQGALKSTSCIAAFQPKHAAARYSSTRSLLLPRCLGRHWGQ